MQAELTDFAPEAEEYQWPNAEFLHQHDQEINPTLRKPIVQLKGIAYSFITVMDYMKPFIILTIPYSPELRGVIAQYLTSLLTIFKRT